MTNDIYGILKIRRPGPATLDIVAEIQDYPGKKVNYQRETYGNERGIDKEKPDFRDRNVKAFAQISTNSKGVTFKKSEYSL